MPNTSGDQSIPPSPPTNLRVKGELTKFEARAKSLAGLADHTYVSCPEINKTFTCFAMAGEGDRLIAEGMGYYDLADLYRTPFILSDTAGVNPYGVNGVCHQAANRFLLATNQPTLLNFKVLGYWLSVALYGLYGKDFLIWYPTVFLPNAKKFGLLRGMEQKLQFAALHEPIAQTMSAEPSEADTNLSENDIISNAADDLASQIIPEAKPKKLKEDIVDLLDEKDRIIGSGMRGEEMANKINELVGVSTKSLASQLSNTEYRSLVGAQKGEEVLVVDPEIAAKCVK